MSAAMNPLAPHKLPAFITAPGETDVLLNGAAIFLVFVVLGLGSVYFRLHALPEKMAHKNANKLQFEVVAVLALLGLFTHNNTFWIAALLLALVPIPDFHGPLTLMADSLARMAGYRRRDLPENVAPETAVMGSTATSEQGDAVHDAAPAPPEAASQTPPPRTGEHGRDTSGAGA